MAPELPPLTNDRELEAAVLDALGEDTDRYAVVIKDLRDGRGASINADRLFYAASLFKLEVMVEILHQHAAGLLSMEETFAASDHYAGFDLGPHLVSQCDEVSIADALAAMMSVSDNVAAVLLQDRAGARNINLAMEGAGLVVTRLLSDSLPINAADTARLVELIARGLLVDEASSKTMLDLMATEKVNDRIPSAVPDGVLVAHKTGNWENATHDAGVVYGTRSTYVVVLMSDIGFEGDAGAVQREVMRRAWDHFEGD
jgi:beta-lactamase class A